MEIPRFLLSDTARDAIAHHSMSLIKSGRFDSRMLDPMHVTITGRSHSKSALSVAIDFSPAHSVLV